MNPIVPTAADVKEAASRLAGWLQDTPVLESALLNERVGARVLMKAECLQHTGSFKIRGALNRLLKLSYDERRAGVVAFSSGNHGAAVALAARLLSLRATVVMPADAPAAKLANVRRLGAGVVLFDRLREDREQIAADIAQREGSALVPPFEHADVVAGQGSVGLELVAAARFRRLALDAVYMPCSGGGLLAGSALAVADVFPDCKYFAVEPEGYDDMARSLASGERQINTSRGSSICDGLMAVTPGAISFAILNRLDSAACAVSDAEVLSAMAFAASELKLVVEPSGAAALAAVRRLSDTDFGCIGLVLSGGNVDGPVLARALAGGAD
jgi:threonine dehydratase